jgi:AmiR/NasT family two-component response regulator
MEPGRGAVQDELEIVSDRDPNPADDGHRSAASEGEIERLREHVAGLEVALLTRDIIGQAKGILMERYRITADEAFDRLRTASQHKNRKVRDLAEELASTGDWESSD